MMIRAFRGGENAARADAAPEEGARTFVAKRIVEVRDVESCSFAALDPAGGGRG